MLYHYQHLLPSGHDHGDVIRPGELHPAFPVPRLSGRIRKDSRYVLVTPIVRTIHWSQVKHRVKKSRVV
jgi:hypothetical protein